MDIPTNLNECISTLNVALSQSDKDIFYNTPEAQLYKYHHGLGQWLRNCWGLWNGSVLRTYFMKLGLTHADDMSSIVLVSFHRSLHGKPVELEAQLLKYKQYWETYKHA